MADFGLRITHLCVGQGLSVLLQLKYQDENGQPAKFVGLLDCGSSAGGKTFCGPALDKIAEAVSENQDTLDYIHISHFDNDHYNLLVNFGIGYPDLYGTRVQVKKMVFGSTCYHDITNFIDSIIENFNIDTNNIFSMETLFRRTGYIPYVLPTGNTFEISIDIPLTDNLYFRIIPIIYHAHLLFGNNFPVKKKLKPAESVMINTGSSILLVSIVYQKGVNIGAAFSYLFTGDATIDTLKSLRNNNWPHFLDEQKMIQIPHHGTKKHIADDEDSNIFTTLEEFLKKVSPIYAVVSAKCIGAKGWLHPCRDTMEVYEKMLPNQSRDSTFTSFYENDKGKKCVAQEIVHTGLYETFALNERVESNTFYKKYKSETFIKKDIVLNYLKSNDYVRWSVLEEIR